MDWYYSNGFEELIVPKDGTLSDRLPSPESWPEWGIGWPGTFPSHKRGAFEEDGFDTISACGDAEMEDSGHENYLSGGSTVDFSDDVTLQRARISSEKHDYQLEDLAGSGPIDDIFMSSLREDLAGVENLDQSFCFSPKAQHGLAEFSDTNPELRTASRDVQSIGSSRCLKTLGFSPSLGLEKDCSLDLEKSDSPPVKDTSCGESTPSEKSNVNRDIDDETSLEAAVLLELQVMATQLTEKTRLCFRDALYRLAKNYGQNCLTQNQVGDEAKRFETRKATELETNIIDRAIANLMFSKMEFNVQDHPDMAALSSNKSYQSDRQVLPDDSEVPGYLYPMESLAKSSDRSGNKSVLLEFGSVA